VGCSASADRVLSTLRANEGDDMSYRALRTAVAYNLPTLIKACEQLTQRGLVEAFDGSRGKRVRLL
jgi:DNA-binding IscR family transcriptional regulator